MTTTYKNQTLKHTNRLKKLLIAFGACLSFLAVTSFDGWSSKDDGAIAKKSECIVNVSATTHQDAAASKKEKKFIAHHNFIASYLLQESSFERKIKKTEERGSFFSYLKQLHKVIIKQTVESF